MSTRTFIPKLIITCALAGSGLGLVTAGTAGASSGTGDANVLLDQLCEARGGTPYATPYLITRCQFARSNKGFETEQAVCEGLAEGEFVLALGTNHMNRASWGCTTMSAPA